MKKLFTLLAITIFGFSANAQTVVYDITAADLPPNDCPGCFCGDPSAVSWLFTPLTFNWTSTGALVPTSVTVEFYESWNDIEITIGVPANINMNAIPQGTYSSINTCSGPLVGSIILNPGDYNVGALNTFEFDYLPGSGAAVEWQENFAWGPGIMARVIVNYPVPPTAPVANPDMASVAGESIGNVINPITNDTDANGDPMTISIISGPTAGGTAMVMAGDTTISYDPPTGFCGEDTIIYQVCDPGILCDTDTIFITVSDGLAPDAMCVGGLTVYLDAAGNATWTAADLDGGSSDNCAPTVSLSADITSATCADLGAPATVDLMITGAYDGPLSGGTPKGMELYVINNIGDLSEYGVGSANNGGGSDGEEFTFPAVSATAGQFIYVTTDSAQFAAYFGFSADYYTSALNVNGDDALELFHMGSAIDVFGDINTDGTGESWEYLDSWAYSANNRTPSTGLNFTDWTYGGPNVWDGETTNAGAASPMPLGTFSPSFGGVVATLTVDDGSFTSNCSVGIAVMDTIKPTLSGCPSTMSVVTNQTGCTADVTWAAPTGADNCSGEIVTSSHNPGDNFPQGTTTVTYWVTDASGNVDSCQFDIIVTTDLMVVADSVTNPLCFGDSTGIAFITASGGGGGNMFDWDYDGTGDTDDMEDQTSLWNGTWNVTVTDMNGCTATTSSIIIEPAVLTSSAMVMDVLCNGDSTGSAILTLGGGSGSLTEDWGTANAAMLPAGTHVYTITDSLGCMITDSVTITEPTAIVLSATSTNEDAGMSNGSIDLTVTGGAGTNTFDWDYDGTSDFDDPEDPTGLSTGNHFVTVMDMNGCTDTLTVFVDVNTGINEEKSVVVNVFPNPSSGLVFVQAADQYDIEVVDLLGKRIQFHSNQSGRVEVNLSNQHSGIYLVKVTSGDKVTTKRLTIRH